MIAPAHLQMLAVPVHCVSMADTLDLIAGYLAEPRLHQICTVNPEFIMRAQEDEAFRQTLQSADLCIPDGAGLLFAARWLGQPLAERVAGADLVYRLAELAARQGWRLFLLGAAPGVAEAAAIRLQTLYPGLIIAGTYAGSPALAENAEIVARVNTVSAEILYVAYGAPRQDLWIARNRQALTSVRVAIGVGGALDFLTGRAVRAPLWLQHLHLEWLHRLWREPWRWRRMLALPRFAWAIIRQSKRP